MALDFSLADFLQSRGQAPAAPTLSDVIGFDQNAAADNNAASNALLESILLNMRQAPQPKPLNLLQSLASAFDSRQVEAAPDYIFRGNPSVPQSAPASNPIMEAITQTLSQARSQETAVAPNSITGDTRRFVDVPAAMSANTEMFQRTMPKNVTQGRVIYPPAQLPPIFQAIKEAQTGATELSGYDPKNPPRAHTISKQQFMALPPLMQQQYLQATKERHGRIQNAKREYETLYGKTTQAALDENSNRNAVKLRDDEEASKTAKVEYDAADANKKATDAAYQKALDAKTKWEKDLASAIATKKVRLKPDGTIDPQSNAEPTLQAANVRRAEQLNISRIDNTSNLQRSKMAKDEADIDFDEKRKTATKRKVSTTTKAGSNAAPTSKAERANQLASQRPDLSRDQIIAIVNAEFK